MIKVCGTDHVIKEGSREHVIWYDSFGRHCSCKDCEINQEGKKMTPEERKNLKALVRTMYDYQQMRIVTSARLRMKADETCIDESCMDDAEISEKDYDVIEYTRLSSQKTEKRIAKEIKKIVESHPLWNKFFKEVRGCGPLMAGAILSEFDIERATTVSKMWQFAGLNSGLVRGKKIVKITKKTDMSNIIKEYENMASEKCGIIVSDEMIRGDKKLAGFVSPYNSWLRTKLCGVLAGGMIKASRGETGKNYAMDYYYPYKTRLEQEENCVMHCGKETPWKDVSPGHRDKAAKRYMIKMFIKDLYVVWRSIEGLPVREPYQVEYLGHKH